VAVAIALGVMSRAGAQDEASREGAAICGNPQCPGIVGALQQDIKACAAKTARVNELEDDVGKLQGKLAMCSTKATGAEDRAASLQAEKEKLQKQADRNVAALREEVQRLKEENGKLRQQIAEGRKPPIVSEGKKQAGGEGKKQAGGEGKKQQQAALQEKKQQQQPVVEEKKQPEASGQPPGEDWRVRRARRRCQRCVLCEDARARLADGTQH
jgi:septal ring factor EnvC (AmiA/AmiB activator)